MTERKGDRQTPGRDRKWGDRHQVMTETEERTDTKILMSRKASEAHWKQLGRKAVLPQMF